MRDVHPTGSGLDVPGKPIGIVRRSILGAAEAIRSMPAGLPRLGGAWYTDSVSKAWEISADDIVQWASRYDAAAVLPKLVRRLLAATALLDGLEMRADAGVRFGGWDGIVRAREAGPFWPLGSSAWEFSVEAKAKGKLDKDFVKRTKAPPEPIQLKRTTYVAVVAQRLSDEWKRRWVQEKKAFGAWLDVRLLDADKLAAWLELSPAVGRWFAGVLGKPSADVTDIEAFLEAWSQRTSPPLPWELVLAGQDREKKAEQLVTWLTYPPSRPLYVRAEKREEALLFAAAAMKKGPTAERWLSRALVVETEEAWRWALGVQRAEPLIVLPAFAGADPGRAVGRAHVILPLESGMPIVENATLDLHGVPYKALTRTLVDAGRPEPQAEDLVRRASGSFAAMQRLSGYVDLPDWAKGATRPELTAFLLAGSWVPSNEADRQVIRRLGGDPEALDLLCVELEKRGEIKRDQDAWAPSLLRWRSPEDAWKALAGGLTETLLRRFRDVVIEVLRAPDTDMSLEQQFEAMAQGEALSCSGALRAGLAESIARLAVHDDVMKAVSGVQTADALVSRLLDPEQGFRPWAALSSLLPTLAEGAPRVFLDVLERSLEKHDEGVSHLFALESKTGFGRAPHTGLLWALEVLGWCPELQTVRRAALSLARLAARDPGGRMSNRPMSSLAELLHLTIPQSHTSVEERLDLLRNVVREEPDVGFRLLLGMFSRQMSFITPSPKPRFRESWKTMTSQGTVTVGEAQQQLRGVLDLLLTHVGQDADRWASLLAPTNKMTEKMLDALEAARGGIADPLHKIWMTLRKRLAWMYLGGSEDFDEWEWARIKGLYAAFQPGDFVAQNAWLFERFPDLPAPVEGEHDKKAFKLEELRQQALAELWRLESPWSLLADLVGAVQQDPAPLGWSLGKAPFAEEVEEGLLSGPWDARFSALIPSFLSVRAQLWESYPSYPWLEDILRRLLADGHLAEAVDTCLSSPQTAELWDVVDRIEGPLREQYWRRLIHVSGLRKPEEWERAIARFLEVGREDAAVIAASWSKGQVSPETALLVLERFIRRSADAQGGQTAHCSVSAYDVEQVFSVIDRSGDLDFDRLVTVEVALLPYLGESKRSAPYLSRAFAQNPQHFVDLILRDDPATHRFFSFWHGYPGEGLPDEDRESALEQWATYVLDKTRDRENAAIGLHYVAEVLARAPDGSDGFWPCIAARHLLESSAHAELRSQLITAKRNHRGWTERALTEGGAQERELTDKFRAAAEQLLPQYPRTATMLDALARRYEAEAEQHDVGARRHQIEWGDEETAQTPAAVRTQGEPVVGPLTRIEVHNVGPARHMEIDLAPRLNLFLGDNSAGKTFAIDILWWALTGTTSSLPARPRQSNSKSARAAKDAPSIVVVAGGRRGTSAYDARHERWTKPFDPPPARGLTVYARVDGGFSVWDPIRNAKPAEPGGLDLSAGYHFSSDELWKGMRGPDGMTSICHGILEDAVLWRSEQREAFALLEKALTGLSPPGEPIQFGLPQRFTQREDRKLPTILMPYGPVFAVHASAAVKRILGLAYALVWGFTNYREAAKLAALTEVRRVTMLVDEVDAHLHPKWQRTILPALLGLTEALEVEVQLVVATHAPLVLASMETRCDEDKDTLFQFSLPDPSAAGRDAEVKREAWRRHGDANAWLAAPEAFKTSPRGPDVQEAIDEASRALEDPDLDPKRARAIDRKLRKRLGELDPFWIRWRFIAEKRGWIGDKSRTKARSARV